ncbi:MAG: endonuclease/exonuclease/phosphatase family protein, partial [Bryobacterales bacterium]|nr:endonuclease/exonuclease/phosphatase family protein [Bryobacterales bacterium]
MKVATWNVNSLRKRLPALLDWLEEHEPDVLCLQETKVRDEDFPGLAFAGTGYHVSYRGKSGFNGVATLTRTVPERVWLGFGESGEDEDDRLLVTLTAELTIVNSYVPQGQRVGSDKYSYKLRWLARIR